MSGTPVTLAPTTRCPSSRVSVRIVPRPRSEKELRPCCPLDVLLVPVVTPVEPAKDGSCAIVVKTFGSALLAICAAPTICVGVGARKPVVVMREPVTTISAAPAAGGAAWGAEASAGGVAGAAWSGGGVWSCGAGAVCAWAGMASATVSSAVAPDNSKPRRRPSEAMRATSAKSDMVPPLTVWISRGAGIRRSPRRGRDA